MRILHTSDWHIGRQFHNVSLIDDQAFVLKHLLDVIRQQQIDLVLIAGDVYDRSVPPAEAVALLNQFLQQVCIETKVPVVMISGNHDSAQRLGFAAELLQSAGLYIASDLAQCTHAIRLKIKGQSVDIFAIPYATPELVRDQFDCEVKTFDEAHTYLVEQIKTKIDPNAFSILMSHCFVGGAEVSESERPLSVGGADTVSWQPMADFDYVALGHLHAPQWRGHPHIRYSGSLLQYSFSEVSHKKSVVLIDTEIEERVQTLELPAKRHLRVIEGTFDQILQQGFADPNKEDYLLIRLWDKRSILDAVGKLRAIYPNLLHLEKPGMMETTQVSELSREQLRRSEFDLFADFFSESLGSPMDEDQQSALKSIIDSVKQAEEQQ